jgi:tetratricopeptide (TPR) repeat protein
MTPQPDMLYPDGLDLAEIRTRYPQNTPAPKPNRFWLWVIGSAVLIVVFSTLSALLNAQLSLQFISYGNGYGWIPTHDGYQVVSDGIRRWSYNGEYLDYQNSSDYENKFFTAQQIGLPEKAILPVGLGWDQMTNQVWLVTDTQIARYDGARWHTNPYDVDGKLAGITAGNGKGMVLLQNGDSYQIMLMKGNTYSIHDLPANPTNAPVSIAGTSDGLWVAQDGLWRWDGLMNQFTPITLDSAWTHNMRFLNKGEIDRLVWTSDNGVVYYETARGNLKTFTWADMGIAPDTRLVSATKGHLADSYTVWRSYWGNWQALSPTPSWFPIQEIWLSWTSLNQGVIASAYQPYAWYTYLDAGTLFYSAIGVIITAGYLVSLIRQMLRTYHTISQQRKVLFSLLPEIPEYRSNQQSARYFWLRAMVLCMLAGWANVPWVVGFIGALAWSYWLPSALAWYQHRHDPDAKTYYAHELWNDIIGNLIAIGVFVVGEKVLQSLLPLTSDNPIAILAYVSFMSLVSLVMSFIVQQKVWSWLGKHVIDTLIGNAQIERVDTLTAQLLRLAPGMPFALSLRGIALLQTGDTAEHSLISQRLLVQSQNTMPVSGLLTAAQNATTNNEQDKALRLYAGVVTMSPDSWMGYTETAMWYHRNDEYPIRALELLERMPYGDSPIKGDFLFNWLYVCYVRALTYAKVGETVQSVQWLERMFNSVHPRQKGFLAYAHMASGMVALAQGRTDEARQDFQQAVIIAPNTSYARNAQRELDKLV